MSDMADKKILEWESGKLDFSAGTLVMGILNVTPDSFSDGGKFLDTERAVARGIEMAKAGAAIIDVGPESTRPGSKPVTTDEQIKRAVPVIRKLTAEINIPVSIDTYNPKVAAAALDAGASMINDITALADERMIQIAVDTAVPVVLMHMQGTPSTMQENPEYDNVVNDVLEYLLSRAKKAEQAGIKKEMIFIDPGIGFGKTFDHNIELLKNIEKFVAADYRVLIGTSRKRFIGRITGKEADDRVFGTAATVALCVAKGVSIVRVHDVSEMTDVVNVCNAITTNKK